MELEKLIQALPDYDLFGDLTKALLRNFPAQRFGDALVKQGFQFLHRLLFIRGKGKQALYGVFLDALPL
jgi:hypothetical protein